MEKSLNNDKFVDIVLTDIQLHAVEPSKPKPWYRTIAKSCRNGKPGRLFFKQFNLAVAADNTLTVAMLLPQPIRDKMQEAENAGKTVRFILPKGGIPIVLGRDAVEKLRAERRKRQRLFDR